MHLILYISGKFQTQLKQLSRCSVRFGHMYKFRNRWRLKNISSINWKQQSLWEWTDYWFLDSQKRFTVLNIVLQKADLSVKCVVDCYGKSGSLDFKLEFCSDFLYSAVTFIRTALKISYSIFIPYFSLSRLRSNRMYQITMESQGYNSSYSNRQTFRLQLPPVENIGPRFFYHKIDASFQLSPEAKMPEKNSHAKTGSRRVVFIYLYSRIINTLLCMPLLN